MKLNRREAQLVRHARSSAIKEFKQKTNIEVSVNGLTIVQMPINVLEAGNLINGLPQDGTLRIELSEPWRSTEYQPALPVTVPA